MTTPGTTIKWPLILVAALGTQAYLLLADIVFVSYYAQLVNPGHETAYYSAFAQDTAGAFVFCFAPVSIYLITTWLCNKARHRPYVHALAYIACYYLLDLGIVALIAIDQFSKTLQASYLLNLLALFVSAAVAAWLWQRRQHNEVEAAV